MKSNMRSKRETLRLKILYRLYEKSLRKPQKFLKEAIKSSLHKTLHFVLSKPLWYELYTSCAVGKTYSF